MEFPVVATSLGEARRRGVAKYFASLSESEFFGFGGEGRKEAGPPFEWELALAGRSVFFFLFSDVHRFLQATDALAPDTTSLACQISEKFKRRSRRGEGGQLVRELHLVRDSTGTMSKEDG